MGKNSADSANAVVVHPAKGFNIDFFGIVCITVVYIAMIQIYSLTLIYGILPDISLGLTKGYVNLIALSILTLLTVSTHLQCMLTKPGFLPKDYEELNEQKLPKAFNKLLVERESMYQAAQERRRLRMGEACKTFSHPEDRRSQALGGGSHYQLKRDNSINDDLDKDKMSLQDSVQGFQNLENPTAHLKLDQQQNHTQDAPILSKEDEQRLALFDSPNLSIRLKRNTYVDKILNKQCYKCSSIKPPHAHHCPSCQRCIAYMDHHCPWINNCVGFYTQKLFVLFNFYCLATTIYALGILLSHGFDEIKLWTVSGLEVADSKSFFLCSLCVFELVCFILFILIVLCDQISLILNRMTVIERVRLYDNRLLLFKKRGYKNFRQVFGGSFSLLWFLPIPIRQQIAVEDLYH